MKNPMKKTLQIAALTGLALVAVNSAQAYSSPYAAGDLLVGFTGNNGQPANNTYDLVVDLGSVSSLSVGQTWDLGSLLVGNLSTLANVSWGVIGVTSGGYNAGTSGYYATYGGSISSLNPSDHPTFNAARTDVLTVGANYITSAPYGLLLASDSASWSAQTLGSINWGGDFFNPNATGVTSINFYLSQESGVTQDSFFALGSTGVLGFGVTPVPEPSTYYLVSGGGLLLWAFRRRVARNA